MLTADDDNNEWNDSENICASLSEISARFPKVFHHFKVISSGIFASVSVSSSKLAFARVVEM